MHTEVCWGAYSRMVEALLVKYTDIFRRIKSYPFSRDKIMSYLSIVTKSVLKIVYDRMLVTQRYW